VPPALLGFADEDGRFGTNVKCRRCGPWVANFPVMQNEKFLTTK
jgi:hypothetical protein